MLGLKLIHVSKRGPCRQSDDKVWATHMFGTSICMINILNYQCFMVIFVQIASCSIAHIAEGGTRCVLWIQTFVTLECCMKYAILSHFIMRMNQAHQCNKYWNWCRCIQRKDSAGVILTASWFNDINIGYRFHISTVCRSCCNNVMYFSKENLDISGSAWKKYHAGMAFLLARIVLVLKLYIQGESCVRPMQASAARLRPGSGILFMTYIDICII